MDTSGGGGGGGVDDGNIKHILTLGNSIIGVSVLAMPFCFQQCGLVLAVLLLLASGYVNRINCHYLVKSAVHTNRRSYELLAFHVFGAAGKLAIELIQIGFLFGICVSFFVIAGDLGPQIAASALGVVCDDQLRAYFLTALCLLVVVPLCFLRNIDSLASISAVSLTFYALLAAKIGADAWQHIVAGHWLHRVELWRPQGVLQVLPIMSLALACQTNVFSIYNALPHASLPRMNSVVAGAINMCCGVYILVGFFGYVALYERTIGGNLLTDLAPSPLTLWLNTGFVMSIALGFPLILFPCRVSVNSLLYRRVSDSSAGAGATTTFSSGYIPDVRFKCITLAVLVGALVVAILVPSIEVVLGLLGSTMGTGISIIFPSAMFLRLHGARATAERSVARCCLTVGLALLVCGTFANLYAADQMNHDAAAVASPAAGDAAHLAAISPVAVAAVNDSLLVPAAVNERKPDGGGKGNGESFRIEPANPQPPLVLQPATVQAGGGDGVGGDEDSLDVQALAKYEEERAKQQQLEQEKKKQEEEAAAAQLALADRQAQVLHQLEEAHQEQRALLHQQQQLLSQMKQNNVLVAVNPTAAAAGDAPLANANAPLATSESKRAAASPDRADQRISAAKVNLESSGHGGQKSQESSVARQNVVANSGIALQPDSRQNNGQPPIGSQQNSQSPNLPQQNKNPPNIPQQNSQYSLKLSHQNNKNPPNIPQQNSQPPNLPQQNSKNAQNIPQQNSQPPNLPQQNNKNAPNIPQQNIQYSPNLPNQNNKNSPNIPQQNIQYSPNLPQQNNKNLPNIPQQNSQPPNLPQQNNQNLPNIPQQNSQYSPNLPQLNNKNPPNNPQQNIQYSPNLPQQNNKNSPNIPQQNQP